MGGRKAEYLGRLWRWYLAVATLFRAIAVLFQVFYKKDWTQPYLWDACEIITIHFKAVEIERAL